MVCGRALALVMRLAAPTVPPDAMTASCYVDDPLSTFIGTQQEQDNNIAKFVGCILAMGFELSFPKAQDSDVEQVVTWTSARLELLQDDDDPGIKVTIKEDILTEVAEDIKDMMAVNAVGVDKLRTLAGRATCISSLLHVWRPFVSMLWGANLQHPQSLPF